MGRCLAFGESFTCMYDDIWFRSLMVDDFALKEVADRRAVLVAVDADDTSRLKRDLSQPQRPTLNRVNLVGQLDVLQKNDTLSPGLGRRTALAECDAAQESQEEGCYSEDHGGRFNSWHGYLLPSLLANRIRWTAPPNEKLKT
jgi:hypothetical protein